MKQMKTNETNTGNQRMENAKGNKQMKHIGNTQETTKDKPWKHTKTTHEIYILKHTQRKQAKDNYKGNTPMKYAGTNT